MSNAQLSNAAGALKKLFLACKKSRTLKKREILTPGLDSPRHLYMVTKGSLRVLLTNEECDGVICIGHLLPGDLFAEQGLFETSPLHLATATFEARSEVHLLSVSHADLQRAAVAVPSIYTDLSSIINQRLGDTTEKLLQMVFEDLDQRCFKALVELTRLPDALTHPLGMQINVTRIELAQMTGCNRESAGRALRALHEKGLIEAQGNGSRIVVLGVRHGLPVALGRVLAQC